MARYRGGNFQRGSVSGVEEAVRKLREKGEHVLTAAKKSLKDGADLIVNDAKSRCPVKTGKLKNSIKAVDVADGAVYELSANAKNQKGIPYGQFVEFDPRINRPFLYPALYANIGKVRANIRTAIQGAISHGDGHGNLPA